MIRRLVFFTLLTLLAACTSGDPGTITLTYPPDGTVVYASALHIAGTLTGADSKPMRVRLVDDEGRTRAETTITAAEGTWSLDLIHGLSGDPSEMTVSVLPFNSEENTPYITRTIVVAPLEHRPDGAYVDVMTPGDGDDVGGDSIEIVGRVSGVETYRLTLVGSDGTDIDSKTITVDSPYRIDDVPFSVELATNAYTGTALLNIYADDVLVGTRTLIMTSAAG